MIKLYCVVLYFPFFPMLSSVLFRVSHLFFVLYYSVVCPSFSLFASFVYLPRSSCSSFFLFVLLLISFFHVSFFFSLVSYVYIHYCSFCSVYLALRKCCARRSAAPFTQADVARSARLRSCQWAGIQDRSSPVPRPLRTRAAPVPHPFQMAGQAKTRGGRRVFRVDIPDRTPTHVFSHAFVF